MNCSEAKARLLDLLDGTLDDAETALVEGHLGGCTWCRRIFDEMSQAHQFLRSELPPLTASISAPQFLGIRIKHKLSHDNGRWWQKPGSQRMWAAAAALAILLVAGHLIYANWTQPLPADSPPAATAEKTEPAAPPSIIVIIRELPRRDGLPANAWQVPPGPRLADGMTPRNFPRAVQPAPKVQSPVLMVKPVDFNPDM